MDKSKSHSKDRWDRVDLARFFLEGNYYDLIELKYNSKKRKVTYKGKVLQLQVELLNFQVNQSVLCNYKDFIYTLQGIARVNNPPLNGVPFQWGLEKQP
jgi:hypothetical protein